MSVSCLKISPENWQKIGKKSCKKKTVCKTEILESKKSKVRWKWGQQKRRDQGKLAGYFLDFSKFDKMFFKIHFQSISTPSTPPPTSFFSSDERVRPRLQGWHRHSSRGGYREETGGCCVSSGAG